jgi:hypothetical protein
MPRKPKPQHDDPDESKRFLDMAREIGAETPSPDFERVFRKVAEQPKGAPPKASGKAGSVSGSSRRSSRKDRS